MFVTHCSADFKRCGRGIISSPQDVAILSTLWMLNTIRHWQNRLLAFPQALHTECLGICHAYARQKRCVYSCETNNLGIGRKSRAWKTHSTDIIWLLSSLSSILIWVILMYLCDFIHHVHLADVGQTQCWDKNRGGISSESLNKHLGTLSFGVPTGSN